jgi:hypothetical protein
LGLSYLGFFAALVSALSVIFRNPFDGAIVELLKSDKKEEAEMLKKIRSANLRKNDLPRLLGWILIAFFVSYAVGLLIGTLARTEDWFAKLDQVSKIAQPAATREEAVYRIGLFRALCRRKALEMMLS